jgi:hypothetical protein
VFVIKISRTVARRRRAAVSSGIRIFDLFNICDQYQFLVSRSKIDVYDLVTEYYLKLHLRMMNMTW